MITLLLGVALIVLVLRDVFQTVIVPRAISMPFHLAPILVRKILWPPVRLIANKVHSARWKAEFLGLFAPLVLIVLLTVWMVLLVTAYGLISFALAKEYSPPIDSLYTALYVSGSSVLTLGSSDFVAKTSTVRLLILGAASMGMLVTASVVSLLFTLIGSIQRREVLVSLTSNIAGSPPSGIAVLETFATMHGKKSLAEFYGDWHRWCADVNETHKAYPILPFFRSNDPFTSWLTALGAVLDSAALLLSVDKEVDCFTARVTYEFGCRLLEQLANNWVHKYTEPPQSTEAEFHSLYKRLQDTGYCSTDEITAKARFDLLRGQYLGAHQSLCKYIAVPYTPLSTEHLLRLATLVLP